MAIFNLFSKSFDPDAYDRQLTALTQRISSTQTQVSRLKRKHRAWRTKLVFYLVAAYIVVVGYTYQRVPVDVMNRLRFVNYVKFHSPRVLALVAAYPVLGYVVVAAMGFMFAVLIDRKEAALEAMKEKHGDMIDEIKRLTNYTKTNELLTKYTEQQRQQHSPEQTPQQAPQPLQQTPQPLQKAPQELQPSQQPQVQTPPAPAEEARSLQDRLLDYIIGSDHNETVESRYALICARCYTHNGLAPPGNDNPGLVVYACPKCGFLNGKPEDTPVNEDIDGDAEPVVPPEIEKHLDIIEESMRHYN